MGRGDGKKQSVSFRFSPRTIDHLRLRAEDASVRQTDLAERYIEEGLRMDEHPLLYFREGEGGRRPALLGTRLDVATVIETIRQNEGSFQEAADYLEIPLEQIDACLRYYAEYKAEVDEWQARLDVAAERAREAWHRQREALA